MPEEDINKLLAGAVVNEKMRKLLLDGLPFEAIATLGRVYPDFQINLTSKEADLLKSIKADTLQEFAQRYRDRIKPTGPERK